MSRDPAEKYLLTRLDRNEVLACVHIGFINLDELGKSLVPYFLDHCGDPMDLSVFCALPAALVTGHRVL